MNQILNGFFEEEPLDVPISSLPSKRKISFLRWQLLLSVIILLFCFFYFIFGWYYDKKEERLSQTLLDNFTITTLYAQSEPDYDVARAAQENTYQRESTVFTVIGVIEIKKLKITYPILSTIDDHLLKIAPCRFYRSSDLISQAIYVLLPIITTMLLFSAKLLH